MTRWMRMVSPSALQTHNSLAHRELKSWLCLYKTCFTSLSPSHLIYKVGIMTTQASQSWQEGQVCVEGTACSADQDLSNSHTANPQAAARWTSMSSWS